MAWRVLALQPAKVEPVAKWAAVGTEQDCGTRLGFESFPSLLDHHFPRQELRLIKPIKTMWRKEPRSVLYSLLPPNLSFSSPRRGASQSSGTMSKCYASLGSLDPLFKGELRRHREGVPTISLCFSPEKRCQEFWLTEQLIFLFWFSNTESYAAQTRLGLIRGAEGGLESLVAPTVFGQANMPRRTRAPTFPTPVQSPPLPPCKTTSNQFSHTGEDLSYDLKGPSPW